METPPRHIVHLDLDSFFVSVERLRDPTLVGQPVVIGSDKPRGVVASCSYEARKFGVRSAMPGPQARRLCPQAIFVRGDMAAYSHYSGLVRDLIAGEAPLMEQASIDEFYLDITGLDKFFGAWKWAQALRQKITREMGLPISMGVASGKTVAKVATNQAKPNGELLVPHGTERAFLAPLAVTELPMLGGKAGEQLRALGVRTLGDLQQMPLAHLRQLFGKLGESCWHRAHGQDDSPVVPFSEHKSISKETTFNEDVADVPYLHTVVKSLAEKVAHRLRKHKFVTGCVAVKVRYAGFDTFSKQATLPYTLDDHKIMAAAVSLFDQVYAHRPVRLVGVRVSNLVHATPQVNLFEDVDKQAKLYQAIDRVKLKHGTSAIARASGWLPPGLAPESPTPNFFNPDLGEED